MIYEVYEEGEHLLATTLQRAGDNVCYCIAITFLRYRILSRKLGIS
jgi:hypothetical protein